MEIALARRGSIVALDDIEKPTGTSAGVDIFVRTVDDEAAVVHKIRTRRDVVVLHLAPDWQLGDDLRAFLDTMS